MDLSLERLTVRLGARTVLADVTAKLRPGRVTALVGPNGAGKSTLLRAAVALIAPAAGTVRLGDRDVATLPPRERARLIGYLPQGAGVHWNVSVRDLVRLGRLPHDRPAEDDAAIARALDLTGTTPFADRPVATLSGGERARVLLARVLAGEPRWLVADEPLASLDPAHALDSVALLKRIAAAGTGVVLVAHDLLHAQLAADDALLLAHGRLVAAGPAHDVLTGCHVSATFGVRNVTVEDSGLRLLIPVARA